MHMCCCRCIPCHSIVTPAPKILWPSAFSLMMGDKHANVTDLTAGVGVSLEDIHPAHASHKDLNPLKPIDTMYEEVSLNSDKVSCEDSANEDNNISIENKSSNGKT